MSLTYEDLDKALTDAHTDRDAVAAVLRAASAAHAKLETS